VVAQGSASGAAVMVGSNLEEWKLFSAMDPATKQSSRLVWLGSAVEQAADRGVRRLLDRNLGERAGNRGRADLATELYSAIETDRFFRVQFLVRT
jgi:hypothetical protein